MTIEEMRKEIKIYCVNGLFDCKDCVLCEFCQNNSKGWDDETDEKITKAYKYLKGEDNMENKNYMEQVAKMLGVEIGEEFVIIDSKGEVCKNIYTLKLNGLYDKDNTFSPYELSYLLFGAYTIKKQWKPKYNEHFWIRK